MWGDDAYVLYEGFEESAGVTLDVGKPQFWGSREPECFRHIVHWHIPFYAKLICELKLSVASWTVDIHLEEANLQDLEK